MTAFVIIVALASIILSLLFVWIKTILEIADADFADTTYKVLWILFVFFMPVVGVCCWYVFGRQATWAGRREYI
jgi:type IV secretory pathway TrbL component